MNVYAFELKREWKSALSWTVTLAVLLWVLMALIYPIYLDSRTDVQAVLDGFPPEFSAAFGISMDDIFGYGGFYAFSYLYLSLCGAMMAAALGLSMFAREKRGKCTDFLLTKPKSRGALFGAKLGAALTLLTASNILYIGIGLLIYRASPQSSAPMSHALLAFSAMLWIELFFLAVAVFVAVFSKKVRSVSGTALAIGMAGFILTAAHSLLEEEAIRYIAPMKYFNVQMAFADGRFEPRYAGTAAILAILLLVLSFVRYQKSDVHAV